MATDSLVAGECRGGQRRWHTKRSWWCPRFESGSAPSPKRLQTVVVVTQPAQRPVAIEMAIGLSGLFSTRRGGDRRASRCAAKCSCAFRSKSAHSSSKAPASKRSSRISLPAAVVVDAKHRPLSAHRRPRTARHRLPTPAALRRRRSRRVGDRPPHPTPGQQAAPGPRAAARRASSDADRLKGRRRLRRPSSGRRAAHRRPRLRRLAHRRARTHPQPARLVTRQRPHRRRPRRLHTTATSSTHSATPATSNRQGPAGGPAALVRAATRERVGDTDLFEVRTEPRPRIGSRAQCWQ